MRGPLGYYRPSEINYLNLEVETRSEGYRIYADSKLPIDAEQLGAALGLSLEEFDPASTQSRE